LEDIPHIDRGSLVCSLVDSLTKEMDSIDIPYDVILRFNNSIQDIPTQTNLKGLFMLNWNKIDRLRPVENTPKFVEAAYSILQSDKAYYWQSLRNETFQVIEWNTLHLLRKNTLIDAELESFLSELCEKVQDDVDELSIVRIKALYIQSKREHGNVIEYLKNELKRLCDFNFEAASEILDNLFQKLMLYIADQTPNQIIQHLLKPTSKRNNIISSLLSIMAMSSSAVAMDELTQIISTQGCIFTLETAILESCSIFFYYMIRVLLRKAIESNNEEKYLWWVELSANIAQEDVNYTSALSTVTLTKGMSFIWNYEKLFFRLSLAWRAESRTPSPHFGMLMEQYMLTLFSTGFPLNLCKTNIFIDQTKTLNEWDRFISQNSVEKYLDLLSREFIGNDTCGFSYFKLLHSVIYSKKERVNMLPHLKQLKDEYFGTVM
jgi:hypothetical protein